MRNLYRTLKKLTLIATLFILANSFYVFRSDFCALANIAGSAHDFRSKSWSDNSICKPCHTPHNANTNIGAPLWNHNITQAVFTTYSSSSLQGTPDQPGNASLVCLSCHDGTIALDSYGVRNGSTFISIDNKIDTDLSDDHPVGILFNHSITQGPSPGQCGKCHNVHGNNTFIGDLPFYNGKVECSTCHDPHNNGQGEKLLRVSKIDSALCLYCHNK